MAVSNIPLLTGSILLQDTAVGVTPVAAKASSAVLYQIEADNTANAAASYLCLWNTASGSVTVGTTAPDMIFMIPASTSRTITVPSGFAFSTALTYAAKTTAGTAGTTAPVSNFPCKFVYV